MHEAASQKVGGEKIEPAALLQEAIRITADLIVKVSDAGFPDWKEFDVAD